MDSNLYAEFIIALQEDDIEDVKVKTLGTREESINYDKDS